MAETTMVRKGQLIRKLFELLQPLPEGLPARDALERLEAAVTLTDYEQGTFQSGDRRFEKVVRFAAIGPTRAGWLVKNKGTWAITDDGREAFRKFTDPESFIRESGRLYRVWKKGRGGSVESNGEPPDDDLEEVNDAGITIDQAEEQAWAEIKKHLRSMPPYDFQELVAALLKAMGYHIDWIAPPGRDGGLDILAFADPLGTRPPRIKVQVKRYAQNVDVNGLRSFMALLGGDDLGLFVTTGGFTKDAWAEARTQDRRRVTLIDLERFFDLWVEHYPKLDDAARRRFPLQPIYFLAPGN